MQLNFKLQKLVICNLIEWWLVSRYWMDRDSAQEVDHRIQKALFIFASGNSLMNPVVYGIFNVRTTSPVSSRGDSSLSFF